MSIEHILICENGRRLGVHFTVRRPKLSIRRPIPTVLLLVKRGIVQTTAVFSDTYLSFENRSANSQFLPANCNVHSLPLQNLLSEIRDDTRVYNEDLIHCNHILPNVSVRPYSELCIRKRALFLKFSFSGTQLLAEAPFRTHSSAHRIRCVLRS